jgi:hypothetical protein
MIILTPMFDAGQDKEYMEPWFKPVVRENTPFALITERLWNVFLTLFAWRTELLPYLLPNSRLQPKK